MGQDNFSENSISEFLSNIRTFNGSIGSYVQHTLLDDACTYSIKLSNGSIRIYSEELQAKTIIPDERFKQIAMRFNEGR
jgi:hypothetical protein